MPKRKTKVADPGSADFPEIPDELLARMKPAQRGRPPQGAMSKQSISLRVDREVLEAFKAGGPGWQSRMQATLKRAAGRIAQTSAPARKRSKAE